jgi:uncharacterized membrane protein
MAAGNGTLIFLRILGLVMLVFSWIPVFNPEVRVFWKGSRVALSRRSNLITAVAMTAWCLGVFGVKPQLCAALCVMAIATAMWRSGEDRRQHEEDRLQHEKEAGRQVGGPPNPEQMWMALFGVNAILLSLSLYAVIRDHFVPPVTEEQRMVHSMAWVLVGVLSVGATVLYVKRPRQNDSQV